MYRFMRTSLTTIGLTSIALAALAGGRAQSADTDLQPALQQIRDEVRDLRHDVKALRDLLEKKSPPVIPPQTTEKQPASTAPLADGAYYIYSQSDSESQLLTPLIDQLRGQGYPITKIDIAQDLKQKYGVDPDPISFHPLLILKQANGLTTLRGLNREGTVRSIVGKFFGPPNPSDPYKGGHFDVILRPKDPLAAAIPDRKVVQIKNYIESFAGDGGKKMTGNEMIASIDSQPVFASEIFQRAGARTLTPDGTSLMTATKALAAGQIDEPSFRQLQLLALRKFSQDDLNTRGWAQAMIASLGKAERERAENAITDEFNKYVENLEKDFKVATVFDVDKKLREQGTSLVSLKAEFRERLLADEYLRGAKKVIAEAPAKRPQSQAVSIDLDRRVTIDCDDRPLSEVLDKIFRDEPIINFSYDQALGTFHYPIVHPIVRYLPAVQNQMKSVRRLVTVAEYLDEKCPKRITLHVKDVPVSVALQRVRTNASGLLD